MARSGGCRVLLWWWRGLIGRWLAIFCGSAINQTRDLGAALLPSPIVRSVRCVHQAAQVIDHGPFIRAGLHHLRCEMEQAVVKLTPSLGVGDEVRPVLACARRAAPLLVARPLRRPAVAEVAHQRLDHLGNQRLRLGLADVGQLLPLDLAGHTAVPAIRLASVRMDSETGNLLARGEQLNFFAAAVRSDEIHNDFGKRLVRTKENHPLRCPADPGQNITAFLIPLAT